MSQTCRQWDEQKEVCPKKGNQGFYFISEKKNTSEMEGTVDQGRILCLMWSM